MGDSNQWELSKENIQPIKQGRRAILLSTAIDETRLKKLNLQKQEFEKEIRIYSGDDPLEIWYKYALWIEQNYPKGGKDGNLHKLLESCFSTIHSSGEVERYRNDERLLDLWIKYINLCPCPLEVYQTLHTKNICSELEYFYESWAWEMEKSGNNKKANAIYVEGLSKAKNTDCLEKSYMKFQARVAKDIKEGRQFTISESNENTEAHRVVLSALKTKGPKAKTPSERVSGIIGTAGKIHISKVDSKSNSLGPGFKIFQDESSSQFGITPSVDNKLNTETTLPIKQSFAKENFKDPAKWTKNKISQKSTDLVPIEDVEKYNKPAFVVHCDDELNYPQSTPVKPEVNGILSIRKNGLEDFQVPLFIQEPFNPLFMPQYDKHKVYCGTEEFSFEEIRAAKFLKDEAEFREREENNKMKGELNSLKEMLRQQQELISNLMNKQAPLNFAPKPDLKRIYEDSWIALNKSTNNTENVSHILVHDDFKMDKQLMDVQVPSNLMSLQELGNSKGLRSNMNVSSLKEFGSPTINTKIANNLVNGFFNGSIFHNSVSGELKFSFECPLDVEKKNNEAPCQQLVENDAKIVSATQTPFTIFIDDEVIKSNSDNHLLDSNAPFQIYSDECNSLKLENNSKRPQIFQDENQELRNENNISSRKKPARTPLTALAPLPTINNDDDDPIDGRDENEENICPKGFHQVIEKRPLAGILQPSINIPFVPLAEQEKIYGEIDEKNVGEVECLDVIKPLDVAEQQEDFTIKVPANPEAFAKLACFASTPRPWCQGIVPQITQNGEDFTMAFPIKSHNIEENFSINSTKNVNEHPESVIDKSEEKSGNLMPPPDKIEKPGPDLSIYTVSNDINMVSSTTTANTMKTHLSPIMEASREYRSSSSSSNSSSCTTLGSHSNYYGISHLTHSSAAVSRSAQISRFKALTGSSLVTMQNESYGGIIHQNETSKSGYFADKSRGESINEAPIHKANAIRSQSLLQKQENKNLDDSFDPIKVAAMLLEIDPCLMTLDCKESTSAESLKVSLETANQHDFDSPLDVKNISYPSDIDPFCIELQEQLLLALKEPVNNRGGFVSLNSKLPQVRQHMQLAFGKEMFHVKKMKGTGSYAQVFHATTIDPLNVTILPPLNDENSDDEGDDESQVILKVQKPACYWEFYICHELRSRLKKMNYPLNVIDSLMRVNRGYYFLNGSILVSQYHKYGTLLDFVNRTKETFGAVHEYIVIYLILQLITLLRALHSSQIIHGDFKPDNIMIIGSPELSFSNADMMLNKCPLIVKLIDFGRSIDMKIFPESTTFKKKVVTEGFTCCEMKDNRPWTYQTDLYGLAGVAHVLLFGSYMNVKKEGDRWKLTGVSFQRRWNKELWHLFFDKLLNISSCSEITNLNLILQEFKNFFDETISDITSKLGQIISIVNRGK